MPDCYRNRADWTLSGRAEGNGPDKFYREISESPALRGRGFESFPVRRTIMMRIAKAVQPLFFLVLRVRFSLRFGAQGKSSQASR